MTSTVALFNVSLLSIIRDRQLIGGIIAFPSIFLLAFAAFDLRLTDSGLGTSAGVDYYSFVVPGLIAMTAMDFAVTWTSASYARLKEAKVLRRLEATPIRQSSFLVGQVAARSIIAVAQAIGVLIVATLLGANFAGNIGLLVVLSLLGTATFMPIGFAIGARASGVESASILAGVVVLPTVFISGAFFPVEGLPDWLQPVVEFFPMVPLLSAMRSVAIDGHGLAEIASDIITVVAWMPVIFGFALLSMRRRAS